MKVLDHGTTSACAENTVKRGSFFLVTGNYLRVRGEYSISHFTSRPGMELPPRARRILIFSAIVPKAE